MSRTRQILGQFDSPGAMVLGEFDLPAGTWFPWHVHDEHWVLPPTRALWLPAGVRHRTGAGAHAALRGVYADPERCPVRWSSPRLIAVRPLLRELLEYLTAAEIETGARLRAEAVDFDLMEPDGVIPISVPIPTEERAARVAAALVTDPADPRGLADFGREVGASERTLARIFLAECRLTFATWRTQARLRAALPWHAAGRRGQARRLRVDQRFCRRLPALGRRDARKVLR
jgi:AraC-like DNA-binding protein